MFASTWSVLRKGKLSNFMNYVPLHMALICNSLYIVFAFQNIVDYNNITTLSIKPSF